MSSIIRPGNTQSALFVPALPVPLVHPFVAMLLSHRSDVFNPFPRHPPGLPESVLGRQVFENLADSILEC
jgi:hypothetical protein